MIDSKQQLGKLRRTRWAVRAVLLAGVVASVIANILHARDDGTARAIAAWPPLAFFVVVEIVSHVPLPKRWYWRLLVIGSVGVVGGVAAWISYWHMVSVTNRYGEDSPHLFPLSVDGLIVVASLALAELSRQIRALHAVGQAVTEAVAEEPARPSVWARWKARREAAVAEHLRKAEQYAVEEQAERDRLEREARQREQVSREPVVDPEVERLMAEAVTAATERNRDLGSPDGSLAGVPPRPEPDVLPWQNLESKPLPGWTPPVADESRPVPTSPDESQAEPEPEPVLEAEVKEPVRPAPSRRSVDPDNAKAEEWLVRELHAGRTPSLTQIAKRYGRNGKPRSENWATARRRKAREVVESGPRALSAAG